MFPKSRFQSIPLSVHGIFLGKVSHTGLPFLCCRDLAAAQKEITALKQKVNDAFAEIKKLAKGQDVALADVEVRKRFPFIPSPVGTVFSFMISVHFHFHFHFYFHFPFLCFSRLVFPSLVQAQPLPFCHFHLLQPLPGLLHWHDIVFFLLFSSVQKLDVRYWRRDMADAQKEMLKLQQKLDEASAEIELLKAALAKAKQFAEQQQQLADEEAKALEEAMTEIERYACTRKHAYHACMHVHTASSNKWCPLTFYDVGRAGRVVDFFR